MTSADDDEQYAAQAPIMQNAWAFAKAFWIDHDMDETWLCTDPLMRRCWVQTWLYPLLDQLRADGYDPEEVVEALLQDEPRHELWPIFARTQLKGADLPVDTETWGLKVNPEPIALDVELLHLLPKPASGAIQAGERYATQPLLMRYEEGEGWRVLNLVGTVPPTPGWPPTLQ
ncbi:hypothetical protein [Streptomyces sp. LN785]|uniref:hypothetical protein n=1 Tax=Streptomyces sp. LN785 TaxID=3112983 RepID=UPI00371C36FD